MSNLPLEARADRCHPLGELWRGVATQRERVACVLEQLAAGRVDARSGDVRVAVGNTGEPGDRGDLRVERAPELPGLRELGCLLRRRLAELRQRGVITRDRDAQVLQRLADVGAATKLVAERREQPHHHLRLAPLLAYELQRRAVGGQVVGQPVTRHEHRTDERHEQDQKAGHRGRIPVSCEQLAHGGGISWVGPGRRLSGPSRRRA